MGVRITTIEEAIGYHELDVASRGHKPTDGLVITVYDPKNDAKVNTIAERIAATGTTVHGIRFYERGYNFWREGRPDDSTTRDEWASLMWDCLPLNADFDRQGQRFKLSWVNGKWRSWKPDPKALRKTLDEVAQSNTRINRKTGDNTEFIKETITHYEEHFSKHPLPKQTILTLFGPNGDERNNAIAQWFSDHGITVHAVRFHSAAYFASLRGTQWSEESIKKWSEFVWENVPYNAGYDDKGNKLKLTWESGRWRSWTPS